MNIFGYVTDPVRWLSITFRSARSRWSEGKMSNEIPTVVLRTARDNAGLSQSTLAPRLGVTPSVVSRMEKAEHADRAMAWRYLAAVGTPECEAIREFYERAWSVSERPSFLHPDRETLWTIESSL